MASQSQPVLPETGIGNAEYIGHLRIWLVYTSARAELPGATKIDTKAALTCMASEEAAIGAALKAAAAEFPEASFTVTATDVTTWCGDAAALVSRSQGASDGPQGQDGQHKTNTPSSPSPTTGADQ